jgi:death-on-curing protein
MPNSLSEPVWLDAEFAIRLNKLHVDLTGEPHQLRDSGLLESAIAAPLNLWAYEGEKDILTLGIRLMLKIAQNHPFAQGNKRAAFNSGLAFIERNGRFVELPDNNAVATEFIGLTIGDVSEREFRKFMRPYVLDPAEAKKFWR